MRSRRDLFVVQYWWVQRLRHETGTTEVGHAGQLFTAAPLRAATNFLMTGKYERTSFVETAHDAADNEPREWVSMTVRRAAILGGLIGVLAVCGAGAYLVAVLRLCPEQTSVVDGSVLFRLCSVGEDLIAAVPVDAPTDAPLYSWRDADGTKPSMRRLQYTTKQPATLIRRNILRFLEQRNYQKSVHDRDDDSHFEWWTDGEHSVGFGLTASADDRATHVEVIYDAGLE